MPRSSPGERRATPRCAALSTPSLRASDSRTCTAQSQRSSCSLPPSYTTTDIATANSLIQINTT
eukprot:6195998-Pleurochrysis_carterae.AAC.4